MKAFLILEDGHVFTGTSIGAAREVIRQSHGSETKYNYSASVQLDI